MAYDVTGYAARKRSPQHAPAAHNTGIVVYEPASLRAWIEQRYDRASALFASPDRGRLVCCGAVFLRAACTYQPIPALHYS